jgi:hypothetical protein
LNSIRKRLTYANVMSSIAIFLALAGASAFAATQLEKNSVGPKQLKKNAVTTAKLKKNAVTKAKIKNGAVNGPKIADGSIGATELNLGSMPFGRVIARLRGTAGVAVPTTTFVNVPLANASYTQGPEEINSYFGALDISFAPGCTAPRNLIAVVSVDAPVKPELSSTTEIAAYGVVSDPTGATANQRLELGPYLASKFEPGTPTPRTVFVSARAECKAGSGVVASNAAVDVVGTR